MAKLSVKKFRKDMKFANDELWSLYSNEAPYNLMYFDGTYLTADCWNFLKAYIWSGGTAFQNRTKGKYYYSPNDSLGDWDGWTMLQHCTNVSQDMSKIKPGEMLYMTYGSERHVGVYWGVLDGKRTVFEFTPMWLNGGFFTNIGPNGERSYQGHYLGNWKYHGMMTDWFDYSDAWEEYPVETKCIIESGTKNYDTGENFASEVYSDKEKMIYYQLEVIQQVDDRVVLGRKADNWVLGPVSADDVIPFTVPTPPVEEPVEPEPVEPSEPVEPTPEPTPEPTDPEPINDENNQNGKLSFWEMLLKKIFEILAEIFGKKKEE